MKTRQIVLGVLAGAAVIGTGNFVYNSIQTRGQLGLVAGKDASAQEDGVRKLMARGVLFDALQGGAPKDTRLAAIATLARMADGGKDKAAFKELLQMLKDPDTESAESKTHPVRDAAKDAVAKVGTAYPEELLNAAKDPDGNIRDQSRISLKQIGAPMKEQMAGRLGDSSLRAPLGDILSSIGPETIPLIAPYLKAPLLKDDDVAAKLSLIETLGKFKVADAALPILPFQTDADPNVRRSVITALANIGDPVGAKVLIDSLNNRETDASARAAAAGALGTVAAASRETAPAANAALLTALSDYDTFVATAAAAGLRRAGDIAAPQIAAALKNTDPTVRARAAEAAGGLRTTGLVVSALKDADPTVRAEAAEALGDLCKRTSEIRVSLAALASATDKPAREKAWNELKRLDADREISRPGAPPAAKAGVLAWLTESRDAETDAKKKETWQKQIDAIDDPANGAVDAKMAPLADGGAPSAFAPLVAALSDTDGTVAQNAATALARLGTRATDALIAQLGNPNETVAYYASRALKTMGRDAVPTILPAAASGKATARWAVITLGEIGDPRAAPAIQALVNSPDPDTAYAAKTALAKVAPRG